MGLFPPLRVTLADAASKTVRSAGRVFRGDVRSADWDGGGDLSGGKDTTATKGYLIDYSSGAAQFRSIFADGGELGSLTITGDLTLSGGSIEVADIRSDNWNGAVPLDIDDDGDSTATLGYGLDASTGHIQATRLFVAPGETATPAVSYIEDSKTGVFFFLSGTGPTGGAGAIGAVCSGGAQWTINNDTSTTGTFAVGGSTTVDIIAANGSIKCDGGGTKLFTYDVSPTAQSGTTVVLYSNGTDYDLVPQSSTIRDKTLVTRKDDLADIELIPSRWQRRSRPALVGHIPPTGDNPWEYGLIAEDLITQDPTLGIWDQNIGRYNDYDTRAVIAVLAAKVNRLENERRPDAPTSDG